MSIAEKGAWNLWAHKSSHMSNYANASDCYNYSRQILVTEPTSEYFLGQFLFTSKPSWLAHQTNMKILKRITYNLQFEKLPKTGHSNQFQSILYCLSSTLFKPSIFHYLCYSDLEEWISLSIFIKPPALSAKR